MSFAPQLVATVESTPVRRFRVENRDDAEWLSQVSGCSVRLIEETVIKPRTSAAPPAPAPSAPPSAPPAPAPVLNGSSDRSGPEKVRQRMAAQPERTFRACDFPDIGDVVKLGNILHRLSEQGAIERVGRGEYRIARAAAAAPPSTGSPGTSAQVMTYMKAHPGEWLRAAQVVAGMGVGDDRKVAITAALVR